jgi:hypothetical protein
MLSFLLPIWLISLLHVLCFKFQFSYCSDPEFAYNRLSFVIFYKSSLIYVNLATKVTIYCSSIITQVPGIKGIVRPQRRGVKRFFSNLKHKSSPLSVLKKHDCVRSRGNSIGTPLVPIILGWTLFLIYSIHLRCEIVSNCFGLETRG